MKCRALLCGIWLAAAGACGPCGTPPFPPISVDAAAPLPRPARCQPGARHCRGNQVWECQADESYAFVAACAVDATCLQGACSPNPVCAPGERHCVGDVLWICRADGQNFDSLACVPGLCGDGACQTPAAVCVPDTAVCQDNAVRHCLSDGSGYAEPPLACGVELCLDGTC